MGRERKESFVPVEKLIVTEGFTAWQYNVEASSDWVTGKAQR